MLMLGLGLHTYFGNYQKVSSAFNDFAGTESTWTFAHNGFTLNFKEPTSFRLSL